VVQTPQVSTTVSGPLILWVPGVTVVPEKAP
jgi:hypothetical protein